MTIAEKIEAVAKVVCNRENRSTTYWDRLAQRVADSEYPLLYSLQAMHRYEDVAREILTALGEL